MANKVYLQVEFGSGNLYEYSKDEKEGFEKFESKNNKISYRRYFKRGIFGAYRGVSIRESNFGKKVSILMEGKDNTFYYIELPLFNQNKSISPYAESLIRYLPFMKEGYGYRVFPYAMEREGTEYKSYGVSVSHADVIQEAVIENYNLEKLSYPKKGEDGKMIDGDIPQIVWEESIDGEKEMNRKERDKYLYSILAEHVSEQTSVKATVTIDGPPQPVDFSNSGSPKKEVKEPQDSKKVEETPENQVKEESSSEPQAKEAPKKKDEEIDLPF